MKYRPLNTVFLFVISISISFMLLFQISKWLLTGVP
jgi:hypothetical protein